MTMSAQQMNPAELLRKLAYLTKDDLPDARWTIDGAFRFDRCLFQLFKYFVTNPGLRTISRISGAPPCLWSLDWFSQRRPLSMPLYTQFLDAYSRPGAGITLVFDNPCIRDEEMQDPYALALVQELVRRNAAHHHAVCVANDRLAAVLRARYPSIYINCHVNRLLMEPAETVRDAAFYNGLAQRYNRVCLHPEDAVNPAVYTAIKEPARMDVVINDSCLRSCPLRRQHLQVLADYRREPYAVWHGAKRMELINRADCLAVDAIPSGQKRRCNLSRAESRALYAAGYRSFIVQAQQFRSAMTLMWDALYCMFAPTPELSNKVALICSSMLSQVKPQPKVLSSGLSDFTMENYD